MRLYRTNFKRSIVKILGTTKVKKTKPSWKGLVRDFKVGILIFGKLLTLKPASNLEIVKQQLYVSKNTTETTNIPVLVKNIKFLNSKIF